MTVREVLQFGNPVLRQIASKVDDYEDESFTQTLIDLGDTLHRLQHIHGRGGGLAAPQIGSATRVVYINARGRDFHLINPVIVEASDESFEVWDFCFSSKAAFLAPVQRHLRVTVEWWDINGEPHRERFEGYFSELLQHEIDHLDGRLFIDLIDRPEAITMAEEWDPALATP